MPQIVNIQMRMINIILNEKTKKSSNIVDNRHTYHDHDDDHDSLHHVADYG